MKMAQEGEQNLNKKLIKYDKIKTVFIINSIETKEINEWKKHSSKLLLIEAETVVSFSNSVTLM